MSTFNILSTVVANRDATPKVLTDGFLAGGEVTETIGCVKTGSAIDAAGSQYRLISIPSNCRLTALDWQAEALGSSCKLDVAVWFPTVVPLGGGAFLASGSSAAIISSSIFATALTPGDSGSPTALTSILNQSLNFTIQKQEQPMWSVLGLASDPECEFDMGFTVRVANVNQGYVGLKARYIY